MQQHPDWLWPVAILLLVVVVVGGYSLYRRLTASIEADVPDGPVTAISTRLQPPPVVEETEVARRLLAVGLNKKPVLDDTAVSGHRQRLEDGEISEETLLQYADDLAYLNRFTAENGGHIPTSFWDVRTKAMEAKSWDEYSIVLQIALNEPVAVLDGIEEEGVLAGHAHQAEARADMALNNAIHRHFVPVFAGDWNRAVEQLRRVLKDE